MTRKVILTYDLPEEVLRALEARAAAEGRRLEDVVPEYLVRRQHPRPTISEAEAQTRKQAFERHFGEIAGDAQSSDNSGIDADLAREYESKQEQ